ncbi:hypothetical protein SCHPADRAFT_904269 [Schizopora paradoxa]|uniref:Tim44-like domain-containing protein n=1 Tax=Schizopora paradoxa TaxID=27342 RepID=A0A0H2S8Z8_9AGAM|nr:hypothetical protein SCHPADRAFT_904269 [Schizopora paradoxa]
MFALTSRWHAQRITSLSNLRLCIRICRRGYAQQRVARTPQSAPQQSTSKPSPTSQVKNRSLDTNAAQRVFQQKKAVSENQGVEALLPAMLAMRGTDLWAQKFPLLDLRIPRSYKDLTKTPNGAIGIPVSLWRTISENSRNRWQNILSMFRMATEFSFPGRITKRRFSPQLFMTQSTKPTAWIAPVRGELLKVYKEMNQAIASGDEKTLKRITSYEFQTHALSLVRKKLKTTASDRTFVWKLHEEIQPCRIVSLRAVPGHFGNSEPAIGNRLVIQLLARFEMLQSLEMQNKHGQRILPNGKLATAADPPPEPRRVLEYLVFENKMWYADGWIVRDQVYEGVQGNYREVD